ncbi:hypothetical protein S40285_04082 [Stachybotrys chlorohalonatus IBT 40285]|uniref:Glutamine synthetase n=1 Tax=Stachybotrys chlorohalonatus (strain IBT 40285) TaxID=1283841 RepID=A0A084QVA8_STAC4|nr:hypothetical protein S40285_04082 [Stachybotrys chlorohalonata IBT 40285]
MASSKADAGEEALHAAIHSTPIIDNHAHPLVKLSAITSYPFLAIATEAHGDAIQDSTRTLAHARAIATLARVLHVEPHWEAVTQAVEARRRGDYSAWVARCLAGIETVLVDDGLDSAERVEPYGYFDGFARSASKRIVRIEHVALGLVREQGGQDSPDAAFNAFIERFDGAVLQAIADPEVVGFKSVICYRTGLTVPRRSDRGKAIAAFGQLLDEQHASAGKATRINHVGLNDFLVHQLAGLIRDSSTKRKKPIQFHTGLGDNDITLTRSSPSHLQEFIREYPTVPIVLLHSGYPFTREIGYLAAMYANVYADIGEVFPFLSRDGQEGVLRQVLELCPASKVLWSTDGHWFPETYLLAVEQMREVFGTVLRDYVRKGDLTWSQAIQLVEDVLFNNSNKLYDLDLELKPLTQSHQGSTTDQSDLERLNNFTDKHKDIRFLRVYWLDMTATPRARAVPIRRARSMLEGGEALSFGVTEANLGLLQNDVPARGVTPCGEYQLHPDLATIRPGPREGHAITMGIFKHKDGSQVALCPRSLLQRTLKLASQYDLEFTLGFEIELVLLRRVKSSGKYEPLDGDGHAWSVSRALDHEVVASVLEEAVAKLEDAGVYIEMIHPESSDGQYEIVLPKAPALQAVDELVFAREIISASATAKGYKMTLHPKPYAMACGTAAHVHISLGGMDGSEKRAYEPFYAGILKHLRSVCAFTYSNVASYERVVDGCWAGGTWVAWGTQNRETPLRKIQGSHWEVKSMDGLANPYLALSAILLAGMDGVAKGDKLESGDCPNDPAMLSDKQRRELGLAARIPRSLNEALAALGENDQFCQLLGRDLVDRYVAVKQAESQLLEGMGEEDRRLWIFERY